MIPKQMQKLAEIFQKKEILSEDELKEISAIEPDNTSNTDKEVSNDVFNSFLNKLQNSKSNDKDTFINGFKEIQSHSAKMFGEMKALLIAESKKREEAELKYTEMINEQIKEKQEREQKELESKVDFKIKEFKKQGILGALDTETESKMKDMLTKDFENAVSIFEKLKAEVKSDSKEKSNVKGKDSPNSSNEFKELLNTSLLGKTLNSNIREYALTNLNIDDFASKQ